MRVFNRHVSMRGLTVFGFETLLISGSVVVAAQMRGTLEHAPNGLWKVVLATALCELCFYYSDLYDLTIVRPHGNWWCGCCRPPAAPRSCSRSRASPSLP
jgi:hypothetical protein